MSKNADLRTCVEISMLNEFLVATDAEAYSFRNVFHYSLALEKPSKLLVNLVMDSSETESLEKFCALLTSLYPNK